MKKVGSSFKILSGLIVGGMILVLLCLLFKMLSREGFRACILGGRCNRDKGDTNCTVNEGKTCTFEGEEYDLSKNLICVTGGTGIEGKWQFVTKTTVPCETEEKDVA
jgi:hypothetical protein